MKTKRILRVAKDVPYTVVVKCTGCRNGYILTPEKNKRPCAYCRGTKEREESRPHPSHKMTKWTTAIRAPAGTPRFYAVRECKVCGKEEMSHPAGHFLDGLGQKCSGVNNET